MNRSILLPLAITVVGIVLLIWGLNASESLASEVSEAIEGAPSNKSIALITIGALVSLVGLISLFRRRA